MFFRQVIRTSRKLATRTRWRFKECCRGCMEKGHECLKGEPETKEVATQIYF